MSGLQPILLSAERKIKICLYIALTRLHICFNCNNHFEQPNKTIVLLNIYWIIFSLIHGALLFFLDFHFLYVPFKREMFDVYCATQIAFIAITVYASFIIVLKIPFVIIIAENLKGISTFYMVYAKESHWGPDCR